VLAAQTPADTAATLATRLQERLAARNSAPGRRYPLSLSFGTAAIDPLKTSSIEELMARADHALYGEKRRKTRADQVGGA
jgi:GGDEF domain-containing protein